MLPIAPIVLAHVSAGAGDFGRCGAGSKWSWLGTIYTPECAAHDAAVRGGVQRAG